MDSLVPAPSGSFSEEFTAVERVSERCGRVMDDVHLSTVHVYRIPIHFLCGRIIIADNYRCARRAHAIGTATFQESLDKNIDQYSLETGVHFTPLFFLFTIGKCVNPILTFVDYYLLLRRLRTVIFVCAD